MNNFFHAQNRNKENKWANFISILVPQNPKWKNVGRSYENDVEQVVFSGKNTYLRGLSNIYSVSLNNISRVLKKSGAHRHFNCSLYTLTGEVLVGFDYDVCKISPSGVFESILIPPDLWGVKSIMQTEKGEIYLGDGRGILKYDEEANRIDRVWNARNCYHIIESNVGDIYASIYNIGIVKYDRDSNSWIKVLSYEMALLFRDKLGRCYSTSISQIGDMYRLNDVSQEWELFRADFQACMNTHITATGELFLAPYPNPSIAYDVFTLNYETDIFNKLTLNTPYNIYPILAEARSGELFLGSYDWDSPGGTPTSNLYKKKLGETDFTLVNGVLDNPSITGAREGQVVRCLGVGADSNLYMGLNYQEVVVYYSDDWKEENVKIALNLETSAQTYSILDAFYNFEAISEMELKKAPLEYVIRRAKGLASFANIAWRDILNSCVLN